MTKTYLLDTSAYRAISSKQLEKLHAYNVKLVTSPYCFWELLTHLDEIDQFRRFKGRFMNFRFFEVLDDPLTQIELSLGVNDLLIRNYVPDSDIIYGTLAAMRDAPDLDQFYASYVKDGKGELRQLRESAERIRQVLDQEEQKFVSFIQRIVNALQDGDVCVENDEDYQRSILELINGQVQVFEDRGACKEQLRKKVIDHFYFYFSAIIRLALRYFQNHNSVIDENDYEDSRIVLHLSLNAPLNFVTGDAKLRTVLEDTLEQLNRLPLDGFEPCLCVCDLDQLLSEI